jgi:hypothetical protein
MGFAEFPDKEKKVFASVAEMKDSLHPAARRSLVAPTTMARLVEVLGHSDTAMKRLTPVLETVAKESAQWEAKRADHSASGHAAGDDAIVQRGSKQEAPIYQTVGDGESVAIEQPENFTRDALRSRAMVFSRDPGVSAQIAADSRLRFTSMPATRLVAATREAFVKGDLATAALLEETIEARDGGPLALSRSQRASAAEYAVDFGESEASIIFAKLEINAIKARLLIGLIPAREVSRTRIALGLRSDRLAAMEKAQAAKVAAAK